MALPQVFRLVQQIWRKPSRERTFSPHLKRIYRYISFFPFLALICGLLSLNVLAPQFSQSLRNKLSDVCMPLLKGIDGASNFFSHKITSFFLNVREVFQDQRVTVASLTQETKRLRYELSALKIVNQELRSFLHMPHHGEKPLLVTEAFGQMRDGFCHAFYIQRHGQPLGKDMPVSHPDGLVGKVMAVGEKAARVMTVVNHAFRVPVIVGEQANHGIAAGDGIHGMRLLYCKNPVDIKVGDLVLTSGQGGVFWPHVPVGEVISTTPAIYIRPAVRLENARIVAIHPQPVDGEIYSQDPVEVPWVP